MKKTIPLMLTTAVLLFAVCLAEEPQSEPHPWLKAPPLAADDCEQKILDVLADLATDPAPGDLNISLEEGRLLRLLAEAADAKHVVEIGTSHGYSGLWFALALCRTHGRLTTHDIDSERIKVARQNFQRAGVDSLVTIVEGDAHDTIKDLKEPIDILFLDADKDGNSDYLEQLLPRIRPGGLIIAHSTTDQADRMPDYLQTITTDPKLETRFLQIDPKGLAITLKKRIAR